MATYYVATPIDGGNDSNPGTLASPFLTLNRALQSLSGGDTLYFRGGTYPTFIHAGVLLPSGSAGSPTVIAGYPGETVTWLPPPAEYASRLITLGESGAVSYVTFRNIIFDGINQNGPYSDGMSFATPAHHIVIEDFELRNSWHSGYLGGASYCIWRRGVIHDVGRESLVDGIGHGHAFYVTGDHNLFENLEIYDVHHGYGIQIQYEGANYNTVNACIFHDCDSGGIVLSCWHVLQGYGGSSDVAHDNTVTNCISYSNGSGIACGFGGDGIAQNHRVYNNTCYNNTYGILTNGNTNNCTISNNICYGNEIDFYCQNPVGPDTYQTNNFAAPTIGVPATLFGTDPLFVNQFQNDFHLRSDSPAVGAGTDLSATFTTDFNGVTRSAPWDLGAYVLGSSPSGPGPAPGPVYPPSSGTTFYVDPSSGNDANPGTIGSPRQTIPGGVALLSSGDTLVLRGGTYTKGFDRDVAPLIPNGGDNNSRTTITVYPGETALVKPNLGNDFGGVEFLNQGDRSYITIDGGVNCGANSALSAALIIDMADQNVDFPGAWCVSVGTVNHHIRIKNCELRNALRGNGVGGPGNFGELINCDIHDNGTTYNGPVVDPSYSGGYGIYAGSGTDWLIENCKIHGNGGFGLHVNATSNAHGASDSPDHYVQRGVIRYNDVYANSQIGQIEQSGILIGGFSSDMECYGNIVHDNGGNCGGIQCNYFREVLNSKIWNNTCTRNNRFGIQLQGAQGCEIRNNICANNDLSSLGYVNLDTFEGPWAGNNTLSNNLCFGTGGTASGDITSDPLFTNAAGGDFTLQAGSPAIDAGTNVGLPYNGSAPDIGALEFGGTTFFGGPSGESPPPVAPPPVSPVTPSGGGGVPSVGGGGGTTGGSLPGVGGGGVSNISFAREDLHHLDLVMDTSRAQWDWVTSILSLYNSAAIYSNGKYKIISDRADLPLRQVFHAGNTVSGKTEIRIGGNPIKPNQVSVQFADQNIHYTENVVIIQDSAQIFAAHQPIKSFDISLRGITRPTEAIREGSYLLIKNQRTRREATFSTGLEGLAVEPGDRCKLGVLMTNFEAGYGGRALDGSSSHIVFDMPVTVQSGFPHELVVWHTDADTLEQRNLGNAPGTWIVGSPSGGFFYPVAKGDRWAVGISSEDLFNLRVVKVERQPSGIQVITAEQYEPVFPDIACPDSRTAVNSLFSPPSQPAAVAATVYPDCTICVSFTPADVVTGTIITPGTAYTTASGDFYGFDISARVGGSLSLVMGSLVGDTVRFLSGTASGQARQIAAWYPGSNFFASGDRLMWWSPAVSPPPSSGDFLNVIPQGNDAVGMRVYWEGSSGHVLRTSARSGWQELGRFDGYYGCVDVSNTAESLTIALVPVSSWGVPNFGGATIINIGAPGCQNFESIPTSVAVTTQVAAPIFNLTFPGSTLGVGGNTIGEISGLVTETCSAAAETTEMALSLYYGTQLLVGSLVVTLNDVNSQAVLGTNLPATVKFQIQNLGVQSAQTAALMYQGPSNSGYVVLTKAGAGSVDTTIPQTLSVVAVFNHYNGSGVHSHDCFGFTTTLAAQTFPNEDTTLLDPIPFTPQPPSTIVASVGTSGLGVVGSGASFFLITHNLNNVAPVLNVTPNWNTTLWNSSFTVNAAMVNFGTTAPSGAAVYWMAR